jgi:hypothetical protein
MLYCLGGPQGQESIAQGLYVFSLGSQSCSSSCSFSSSSSVRDRGGLPGWKDGKRDNAESRRWEFRSYHPKNGRRRRRRGRARLKKLSVSGGLYVFSAMIGRITAEALADQSLSRSMSPWRSNSVPVHSAAAGASPRHTADHFPRHLCRVRSEGPFPTSFADVTGHRCGRRAPRPRSPPIYIFIT